jgi:DDE superfamily endonuclease
MGGAHTVSYVTVKEDGSDRYNIENLQHKYSKAPAWMFHRTIVDGKKGPGIFWEKEWGTMNSANYDEVVLAEIERFFQEHTEEGYIFMQDNAPSHRSQETRINLLLRRIPYVKFPPYSLDLNLIEHVWNWMKDWIQDHYWQAWYDVAKVPLQELRRIILEAWNAVPDDYIQNLYNCWWDRCQAVIDANGGPTKY